MPSELAIRARNVSKVYSLGRSGRTKSFATIIRERAGHPFRKGAQREQFRALDDVTFDVAPGEVVGVVGKNGAGKSTLLKILSRITYPTEGYIHLEGRVGSLLEVGTGFHPELTGIENVYLNGTILGMTRREIDTRLDAIVEFAEVHKFLETPVKRYSSGMRVRLAFSVAAHLEPEILIIDEVLSVGDAGFQAKCLDKMKSIASEDGRTVLYVSHNLVTLEYLCPRTLLLVDGQLAFDGPTDETVSRYLGSFPQGERGVTIGVFDLAAADRSVGGYQKVFQRLELRPSGGAPSEIVRMGERLRMEILVQGLDAISGAVVVVNVMSSSNQHLMRLTSSMVPLTAAHPRRPTETITLDIPSLMLLPGDYHLDLQVKDGYVNLDHVRSAGTFSVVPSDVFGTGYRYSSGDGLFLVPWEWELRPSSGEGEPQC